MQEKEVLKDLEIGNYITSGPWILGPFAVPSRPSGFYHKGPSKIYSFVQNNQSGLLCKVEGWTEACLGTAEEPLII